MQLFYVYLQEIAIMTSRKGTISVNTNDIFPIIKKWLYSEHDIFLRELTANATDAITKRSTLARTMNQEIPTGKITVTTNKTAKTITNWRFLALKNSSIK
jgi:molecular chaperone HtpG